MRPYFEVVAKGLKGLVDGTDFFDMRAEDVLVEYAVVFGARYRRRRLGASIRLHGQPTQPGGRSEPHSPLRYWRPPRELEAPRRPPPGLPD